MMKRKRIEEAGEPANLDLDREVKIREVLASDDFLPLPSKFEIHEWSIMERFAESLEDDEASERLLRAIHRPRRLPV